MKVSDGRIQPDNYDQKDPWTYKVRGGLLPGWLKRLCRGKRDFWREWDFDAEELQSRDSYAISQGKMDGGSGMSTRPETVLTGDNPWEVQAYGNKTDISIGEMRVLSSSSRRLM